MLKTYLISLVLARLVLAHTEPNNVYVVPVPENLKAYSVFSVGESKLRIRKDSTTQVEYDLPELLMGPNKFKIEAKGKYSQSNKKLSLNGPFVNLTCELKSQFADCDALYKNLPIMLPTEGSSSEALKAQDAVKEYIASVIKSPEEVKTRIEVFAIFSHEAAGKIIRLRVRNDLK